jgi:hypothetical protein
MVELATTVRDHGSSNYSLTSKKIDEIFAPFGIKKSERIDPLITELSGIVRETLLEAGINEKETPFSRLVGSLSQEHPATSHGIRGSYRLLDSGKRKSTRLELGLSLATSSQNHGNLGHSRYSNHQRSVHTETSYTEGPASS